MLSVHVPVHVYVYFPRKRRDELQKLKAPRKVNVPIIYFKCNGPNNLQKGRFRAMKNTV